MKKIVMPGLVPGIYEGAGETLKNAQQKGADSHRRVSQNNIRRSRTLGDTETAAVAQRRRAG